MRTKLKPSEIFKGFTLVNARSFSPNKWLEQEEPSKVIMAILGDYQKKNAKLILTAIFQKLRRICKTDAELKKYVQQLIIISRMRNLEELTTQISEEMPITIDIEKDYLYKLGLKKAEDIVKKANERVEQIAEEKAALVAKITKEKATLQAKATKAIKEKAALQAKATKEKATLQAKATKAVKEKAALQAKATKVAKEKAALQAKATKEKAAFIAKVKAERKASIQKLSLIHI